jgi:hypothetical protein
VRFLGKLTEKAQDSLGDIIAIWKGYTRFMPVDRAVTIANLCFQTLARKDFENEVLRNANILFHSIPSAKIMPPAKLKPKFHAGWTKNRFPLEPKAEVLMKWCAESSAAFADAFVEQFPSIFEGEIGLPDVRTTLSYIFLRRLVARREVTRIEGFIREVKSVYAPWARSLLNQEKIASLFGAMSRFDGKEFRQLEGLTWHTLKDPSAGKAELEYVKAAIACYDEETLVGWFTELEAVVKDKISTGEFCKDYMARQLEVLFTCESGRAERLRSEATLSDFDLMSAFEGKWSTTLRDLICSGRRRSMGMD